MKNVCKQFYNTDTDTDKDYFKTIIQCNRLHNKLNFSTYFVLKNKYINTNEIRYLNKSYNLLVLKCNFDSHAVYVYGQDLDNEITNKY